MNIVDFHLCIQGEGKYAGIPHILIRVSGCPMRCAFGNSLCDSPFTSWTPEKGNITEEEIYEFYSKNSQIKYTMITGGEPFTSGHTLLTLIKIAKKFGHFVTIETAGVKAFRTDANFISISPKLSSSIPDLKKYIIGGREVEITENIRNRHIDLMLKPSVISDLVRFHKDYQIKPVISDIQRDMEEVILLLECCNIPKKKVYLMPAGSTNEELQTIRPQLMEYCQKEGYNYTDRIHIVAYRNRRGV